MKLQSPFLSAVSNAVEAIPGLTPYYAMDALLCGGTPQSESQQRPPFETQAARFKAIEDMAKAFYVMLDMICPQSEELGRAQLHLKEAEMWARLAMQKNEPNQQVMQF